MLPNSITNQLLKGDSIPSMPSNGEAHESLSRNKMVLLSFDLQSNTMKELYLQLKGLDKIKRRGDQWVS